MTADPTTGLAALADEVLSLPDVAARLMTAHQPPAVTHPASRDVPEASG